MLAIALVIPPTAENLRLVVTKLYFQIFPRTCLGIFLYIGISASARQVGTHR